MTNHIRILILNGLIFLTALQLISAQFVQISVPLNTAVDAGSPRTYLNCSTSGVPTNQYSWAFTSNDNLLTGAPASPIVTGCTSRVPDLYEVDSSTPGSCNLIILNASPGQVGLYTCSPGAQTTSSAEFIVMETQATCSNVGNEAYGYTFYCKVTYTSVLGNTVPSVRWYDGSGLNYINSIKTSLIYANSSYYASWFSVAPGVPEVPPNLCQVAFGASYRIKPGQSSNSPTYTSYCNVSKFSETPFPSIKMSRNIGIIAGRTRVIITLISQDKVDDVMNVYFGNTTQLLINSIERKNRSCIILNVYSPPAFTVGNVSITIENSDGYKWTDPTAYFEYKENPTVTSLFPFTQLTSGGSKVTIVGTNLEAAESSKLYLNLTVYRRNFIEHPNITSADCFGIIQDTDNSDIINKTLLCRMPRLNLPYDFMKKLEENTRRNYNIPTRRRRSANGDYEIARFWNDADEHVIATLSITTDGFQPDPRDSINVNFFPSTLVTFNESNDVVWIKSGKPENQEIMGSYMNTIDLDNFVVTIGNVNCSIITKSDNSILYLPPNEKPNRRSADNDILCNDGHLDIKVSINQEHHNDTQWLCGCAEYYNTFPVLLVVLVTVLVGITLIIIVVVLIVWCTKFCKKNNPNNNQTVTPVAIRNNSPKSTDKGQVVRRPNKDGGGLNNNYNRTIPDEANYDNSINYSRSVNNYNRTIPSIYP